MRCSRLVAGVTALALLPASAWADPATEASYHFDKASAFAKRGDLDAALQHYFVSNRLSRNGAVIFNIARCFELLGKTDDAFTYYSEYLAEELEADKRREGEAALQRILPQVARLSVTTRPPDATLYLDRRNLGAKGRTPRRLAHRPGDVRVIIERDGHHPVERQVTLVRGQEVELALELAPVVGAVRVGAAPAGAEVRVDAETAEIAGRTPVELALSPGVHELFLSAPGHLPGRKRVAVQAEGALDVHVALEALPPPTGRITLTSNKPGAVVTLDGAAAGFTPTVLDDVPLGRRTLEVRLDGWRSWQGEVDVAEGAPVWATVSLAPEIQDTGRGPWPWALLAAAGAGLAAGATFGVLARRTEDDYDKDPSVDLREEGRFQALLADVLIGAGLVLGGAAATVFVVTQPEEERDSSAYFSGGPGG